VLLIQGELEHRTPKARYKRTDKKTFVKQLARLERRESRLRRIREKLSSEGRLASEPVPRTPQEHHHIGVSEKHHENIGHFLRKNEGDPAVQVQIA
jgi:predicted DNA-binding protein with PD1-like motif